jgi:NAD+ synthase (glutamine-hydrolysing)
MTAHKKAAGTRARKPKASFGFVRVAAASPNLKVADCDYNVEQMIALMARAETAGVSLLIFPELSVTGYTCADLFQSSTLLAGALAGLAEIVRASKKIFSGVVFVGMPLAVDCQLFNCAVAVHRGKILGVVPKMFPPNYKEFYESRWFRSAAAAVSREVEVNGEVVPFGTDLLFKATDVDDLVVGAEVCEDLWVPVPPSCLQALHGATVLVNLSASNELVGKDEYRRDLVANQAARCIAAYIYSSCGNGEGDGESTTDLVWSGHCLISENGSMLAESEPLSALGSLTVTDVDLDRIKVDRLRTNSWGDSVLNMGLKREFRQVRFTLGKQAAPDGLVRKIDAHPFVPRAGDQLDARCRKIFGIEVASLAKRLKHVGSPHVTIGVSGGLDSTLALLVMCKVADMIGWQRSQIRAYTMPGFGTTKRTKRNAHDLMRHLGVTPIEVDIRPICLEEMRAVGHKPFGIELKGMSVRKLMKLLVELPPDSKDLIFENVQARMRTNILMNLGFVVGTGDLSELILGWCTYNGDHMSGYNPNASIPKTLVKFLVRWAAMHEFDGPVRDTLLDIFATEISPELLPTTKDGKIAQKTESVVGPYELHDFFIYWQLRYWMSPEKILYLASQTKFDTDYSQEEIRHWLKVMISRFFSQQFKRSALPDGPKVGSVSVSPRGDLRMPSDAVARLWLKWADVTPGRKTK